MTTTFETEEQLLSFLRNTGTIIWTKDKGRKIPTGTDPLGGPAEEVRYPPRAVHARSGDVHSGRAGASSEDDDEVAWGPSDIPISEALYQEIMKTSETGAS